MNGAEVITPVIALVDSWLARRIKADAATWLAEVIARAAAGGADGQRALFIAFGLAARRCGKDELALSTADLAAANRLVPGWDPSRWSVDQTARTRLVLALPSADAATWLATLDRLFAAAGLEELVALYQALPLLPHQRLLAPRVAEGVRSNMKAVFTAIALDNPAPAALLAEGAWDQLVLKALFVVAPVARIVGAQRRANPRLAQMLIDYARERIAAKRPVPVDLWDAARPGCEPAQRAELDRLQASALAVPA